MFTWTPLNLTMLTGTLLYLTMSYRRPSRPHPRHPGPGWRGGTELYGTEDVYLPHDREPSRPKVNNNPVYSTTYTITLYTVQRTQ